MQDGRRADRGLRVETRVESTIEPRAELPGQEHLEDLWAPLSTAPDVRPAS